METWSVKFPPYGNGVRSEGTKRFDQVAIFPMARFVRIGGRGRLGGESVYCDQGLEEAFTHFDAPLAGIRPSLGNHRYHPSA